MSQLLKIILSLSISGSLLILVLFLCKPIVKNKFSKRWQYYIWLIVIARLLIPFAPETNLMNTLFQHFDNTMTPVSENHRIEQNLPTASINWDKSNSAAGAGYWMSPPSPLPDESILGTQPINALFLMIWLIVAISLWVRKITIYQSFVKYTKAGCIEVSDLTRWERVGELVEQTNIKGTVGLYTNSLISSPLLVGFFRPCIILPTTLLPDSDFQYTILHELIHCKRRDMFYKWLVQFAVCLHWFNPFVHLMSREINRICELSCDEAVIRKLDEDQRRLYGNTLLNAVVAGGGYKDSLASVTLSENKEKLKERLDAIMNFKKKTHVTTTISIALTFVLYFGATAAGAYAPLPQGSQNENAVSHLTVINLSSNGQGSIIQSGSFESQENQVLMLTTQSDIRGGVVDLFLFSPDGKEQRITFEGTNQTKTVILSSGRWSYNCTGFFTSGDINIFGELKNSDNRNHSEPVFESQAPDLSGEAKTYDLNVINLSSNGRGCITQSGSFESQENQVLTLTTQSNIIGGAVDLTLFSPDGKQHRLTFGGSDQTETIVLYSGRWSYNCTGFFTGGDLTISGELKNSDKYQ